MSRTRGLARPHWSRSSMAPYF